MKIPRRLIQKLRRWKHWPRVQDRARQYYLLTRLHRPIGIYLLLWPTLWAIWMASNGRPDLKVLFIFMFGVILMRSAGCVINDYADRKIDPHVTRTRDRPLASGKVTPREALGLFAVISILAFGLVLLLNPFTIYLSFGGIALAALYPFMKRHTYLPQVVLGAAFAWAVPMAFAAIGNSIPPVAWILYIATVVWTTAYDTMYAMVDREDDLRIGVKSTAILFGDMDRIIIAMLQGLVFMALILLVEPLDMGLSYHLGLLAAAALAGYEQYLIRQRRKKACFQAFLNNHWFGTAIFIGIFVDYMVRAIHEVW